ncbi:MAG: hypothetical protein M1820_006852 [Bogoriella megaspora]|nr:MAG: hypothetical protein M1820_006852 [Bogoriella megaspora]
MVLNLSIGTRCSYNGHLCTVRYIGEVKGTQGAWLGIEWDDPTRGKHSGKHGNKGLSKSPSAGSFVRPNRPTDQRRTFLEALNAKYVSEDINTRHGSIDATLPASIQENNFQHSPVMISGKVAEEVGFDKVRRQLSNLQELRIVILDGMKVSLRSDRPYGATSRTDRTGNETEKIGNTCPKITELDLSRNLFQEWTEIFRICDQLSYLKALRLDGNRLQNLQHAIYSQQGMLPLPKVVDLSLSCTLLRWDEVAVLTTQVFGNIDTLAVSGNELCQISNHRLSMSLKSLDLEDNELHDLADIQALSVLPNLQRLSLRRNNIKKSSDISKSEEKSKNCHEENFAFPYSLSELDLSYNSVGDWSIIDGLHRLFPGLRSLRIAHNPLYQDLRSPDGKLMSADDGYAITIARLPKLTVLNFSPITPKDRFNAETFYLSTIAAELATVAEGQGGQVIKKHWRYAELCKEYGDPVIKRSAAKVVSNTLGARLIQMQCYVIGGALHQPHSRPEHEFVLEVPGSLQVYSVMGYVGKQLGIPPMRVKLVWETDEWDPVKSKTTGSDSEDEEEIATPRRKATMVKREVVIVAGTRSIGTWIECRKARVRVELKDATWHSVPR